MTRLTDEQQAALKDVLEKTSTAEFFAALANFEQTLPPRSQAKREEIAASLNDELERTSGDHKTLSRLLAALASVDTPNAAAVVVRYAASDPAEVGDRIQLWALISLTRMTSYNDTSRLLQEILTRDNSNNRIKALVLRLLIQCNDHESETRKEYVDQLIEMGRGNADHRWAVWRSLRNHLRLDPLPPDVERRFIPYFCANRAHFYSD